MAVLGRVGHGLEVLGRVRFSAASSFAPVRHVSPIRPAGTVVSLLAVGDVQALTVVSQGSRLPPDGEL